MTATYLHRTISVSAGAATFAMVTDSLVTAGPAASAWWVIKAVKISVDFSADTPPVPHSGGHVITSLFFGAPNATDANSFVDNTMLLNDTSARLAAVVVYPGQYVTAQFANSASTNAVATMEIFGIEYDTPPPIEALPSIAGEGFRGGLISGANLAATESSFILFQNPGPGEAFHLLTSMLNPLTLYDMTWTWSGTAVTGPGANYLGQWELWDTFSNAIVKTLITDEGPLAGSTGPWQPQVAAFGGISYNEFAYAVAGANSGFMDLVFRQINTGLAAGSALCTGVVSYSRGLNIPVY